MIKTLEAVNLWWNQFVYVADVKDHWQTPIETIERGGGDCEDIAFGKYFTLVGLGVPGVLLCYCHQRGNAHMVVVVAHDGKMLVLDKNSDFIMTTSQLAHSLVRIYSFSHTRYIVHLKAGDEELDINLSRLSKWGELLERIKNE